MAELTMRTQAWYGDETTALRIPDGWQVSTSTPPHSRALNRAEMLAALRNPIGTPTIAGIAEQKSIKSAAIVLEDMTRPTPMRQYMSLLLDELHAIGLDEDSIRFVLALGCHRQAPREEMVKKLGANVVGRYEVLNHDLAGRFLFSGRSSRGTPIYINEAVMQADLKILLGTTYPRGGTGFGGGAKCLVPGVAAMASIESYHSLRGGAHLDPESDMRQDIEEIARHVGVDFIVNTVLNGDREIVGMFAGDVVEAHRAAADHVKQVSLMPILSDADVVISNAYPFDTNMRYTWRGSWVFGEHPDALHILVDYSTEGSGYHQLYKARGKPFGVPSDGEPSFHLYSPVIGAKEVNEVHANCRHHGSWRSVVDLVRETAGDSPKVAFYPQAGIGWRS